MEEASTENVAKPVPLGVFGAKCNNNECVGWLLGTRMMYTIYELHARRPGFVHSNSSLVISDTIEEIRRRSGIPYSRIILSSRAPVSTSQGVASFSK